MANSMVQPLQIAVRRRLWRGQFVAAARLALWGTAGLMLLAVVVHLSARPVRVDSVVSAMVVLWTAMMAWAGMRRPPDSACALWADRHLGGASAFSTLLEMHDGKHTMPDAPALQWLEHWAAARVPHSLRLLTGLNEPARLSRPLLSMLVCTALATIVLTLPDTTPSARQELAARSPSGVAGRQTPNVEPHVSTELVSTLASALRSAESRRASDRRDDSRIPAAGPGKSDASTESRMVQPGDAAPGERTTGGGPLPGTGSDTAPTAGAKQTSGAASGRDAGDSRDDRADAGVSRVPQRTIQVQRHQSSERRPWPERRADLDQLASFDDDLPMQATTGRQDPVPPAATPPPATDATTLTPTKAAYVQAWMKASRQLR